MTASDHLQRVLIEEICLVITSARELRNEPKSYGSMRLVEGIRRLLRLMQSCGFDHDVFEEVATRIEMFPLDALPDGEDAFIDFMDELVFFLSSYIGTCSGLPSEKTAKH